jgi:hypothetical protein
MDKKENSSLRDLVASYERQIEAAKREGNLIKAQALEANMLAIVSLI